MRCRTPQEDIHVHPEHCHLSVFLKNIYFLFQGMFYEQVQGVAMGVTHKPNGGHLFMEDCEAKPISTSTNPQNYGECMGRIPLLAKRKNTETSS